MKKFLTGIVLVVMAFVCLFATACSGKNWKESDVTLKEWGAILENDGFIAKTENYVYFINGVAENTEDNTFGMPIKGSLVAAKRSDIESGAENVERCIVVPKLFVASDTEMGVFLKGDYVYYMTPTTDKNSSGSVSHNEMEFARTKLDGTETKTYIKIGTPSDKYRILENDGTVYLVINDSTNSRIVCYSTADGSVKEIAKTDSKTNVKTSAAGNPDEYESLADFTFVDRNHTAEGVVAFTNTVYLDQYDEDEAGRNTQYSRTTAQYNKLYVYKIGDEKATLALNGKAGNKTYAVNFIKNGVVYYTATPAVGLVTDAEGYAASVAELLSGNVGDRVYNSDYANSSNVIVSLDEVYTNVSGTVKRVSLTDYTKSNEENVATIDSSSTLIEVKTEGNDTYLYYLNDKSEYCRIKLGFGNKYERISDGSVVTAWYVPYIIENYAYYCDNSSAGFTYVRAVSIAQSNLVPVDADGKVVDPTDPDANEINNYYFDGSVSLAIMTDSDAAKAFDQAVQDVADDFVSGKLVFDKDDDGNVILVDGAPVIKKIDKAQAIYNALNENAKDLVTNLDVFNKYKEAFAVSKVLYKLNDFDKLTDAQKTALENDYLAAKARLAEITANGFTHNEITDLCVNNMVWYYQQADSFFNA